MDDSLVYVKTAKGIAEVAGRAAGLNLSARRVLIMIDGRRSIGELAPLLRPGEIDGVIGQLEQQGLVQRVGGGDTVSRSGRPTDSGPVGTLDVNTVMNEPPEERNLLTLEEAKRRAVRELLDRLGPDGDQMAQRIERCRNADELRERLREAERLIAGFFNESAAQDFVRALRRR